ncbi:uncharacterized protein LOC142830975 isoform X1 [Pelodiscus sinensis]|uniref:uncharacterized protein LOC142830975 isoform X1 n=1 Tax=Pelodiscus sinensis TaxID=13735 RepID=UPI003F6AE7D6
MSLQEDPVQREIHQDWANREYIEVITSSIKKIADFLNSFGDEGRNADLAADAGGEPTRRRPGCCAAADCRDLISYFLPLAGLWLVSAPVALPWARGSRATPERVDNMPTSTLNAVILARVVHQLTPQPLNLSLIPRYACRTPPALCNCSVSLATGLFPGRKPLLELTG